MSDNIGKNILTHYLNNHKKWHWDCILSAIRGFRNGILTGVRIRIPYIFQAVIYAILSRGDAKSISRVKFVIKQMFFHGKNLGLFVLIYKSICCIFRNLGIKGGIDSLIAGFIGGYYAFGDSKSTSGSVNNQIVLYLFARAIIGIIQGLVKRKVIPSDLSTTTPKGFRIFAGITLALILYLTEYEPEVLNNSFMSTMTYLYHQSDSGSLLEKNDQKFSPIILVIIFSLLGSLYPQFSLDSILKNIFDINRIRLQFFRNNYRLVPNNAYNEYGCALCGEGCSCCCGCTLNAGYVEILSNKSPEYIKSTRQIFLEWTEMSVQEKLKYIKFAHLYRIPGDEIEYRFDKEPKYIKHLVTLGTGYWNQSIDQLLADKDDPPSLKSISPHYFQNFDYYISKILGDPLIRSDYYDWKYSSNRYQRKIYSIIFSDKTDRPTISQYIEKVNKDLEYYDGQHFTYKPGDIPEICDLVDKLHMETFQGKEVNLLKELKDLHDDYSDTEYDENEIELVLKKIPKVEVKVDEDEEDNESESESESENENENEFVESEEEVEEVYFEPKYDFGRVINNLYIHIKDLISEIPLGTLYKLLDFTYVTYRDSGPSQYPKYNIIKVIISKLKTIDDDKMEIERYLKITPYIYYQIDHIDVGLLKSYGENLIARTNEIVEKHLNSKKYGDLTFLKIAVAQGSDKLGLPLVKFFTFMKMALTRDSKKNRKESDRLPGQISSELSILVSKFLLAHMNYLSSNHLSELSEFICTFMRFNHSRASDFLIKAINLFLSDTRFLPVINKNFLVIFKCLKQLSMNLSINYLVKITDPEVFKQHQKKCVKYFSKIPLYSLTAYTFELIFKYCDNIEPHVTKFLAQYDDSKFKNYTRTSIFSTVHFIEQQLYFYQMLSPKKRIIEVCWKSIFSLDKDTQVKLLESIMDREDLILFFLEFLQHLKSQLSLQEKADPPVATPNAIWTDFIYPTISIASYNQIIFQRLLPLLDTEFLDKLFQSIKASKYNAHNVLYITMLKAMKLVNIPVDNHIIALLSTYLMTNHFDIAQTASLILLLSEDQDSVFLECFHQIFVKSRDYKLIYKLNDALKERYSIDYYPFALQSISKATSPQQLKDFVEVFKDICWNDKLFLDILNELPTILVDASRITNPNTSTTETITISSLEPSYRMKYVLPKLIYQEIVEYIYKDHGISNLTKLQLATVSKQFFDICSNLLLNHYGYGSKNRMYMKILKPVISYDSPFCLIKTIPKHIGYKELLKLPFTNCRKLFVERIESLTLNDIFVDHLTTPLVNLKHLDLVITKLYKLKSTQYYFAPGYIHFLSKTRSLETFRIQFEPFHPDSLVEIFKVLLSNNPKLHRIIIDVFNSSNNEKTYAPCLEKLSEIIKLIPDKIQVDIKSTFNSFIYKYLPVNSIVISKFNPTETFDQLKEVTLNKVRIPINELNVMLLLEKLQDHYIKKLVIYGNIFNYNSTHEFNSFLQKLSKTVIENIFKLLDSNIYLNQLSIYYRFMGKKVSILSDQHYQDILTNYKNFRPKSTSNYIIFNLNNK
ncbi:transmembrane protein [Tieghemostelium lacteum]|uniref:Transmembrane protein n=1 Tax=Tieghemostelium lacteum TaxID=361077 RepID=A0A151Z2N9_TIELA|nr:transmembrane protein [Tieghemostelium lacteum]|eukprot:KYQ88219.1 transmembrane protein [Tieghemostelium lacteum]